MTAQSIYELEGFCFPQICYQTNITQTGTISCFIVFIYILWFDCGKFGIRFNSLGHDWVTLFSLRSLVLTANTGLK